MALAEVDAEMAAWERYRSYVAAKCDARNYHGVFIDDDASRGLWRDWKETYEARAMLSAADSAGAVRMRAQR